MFSLFLRMWHRGDYLFLSCSWEYLSNRDSAQRGGPLSHSIMPHILIQMDVFDHLLSAGCESIKISHLDCLRVDIICSLLRPWEQYLIHGAFEYLTFCFVVLNLSFFSLSFFTFVFYAFVLTFPLYLIHRSPTLLNKNTNVCDWNSQILWTLELERWMDSSPFLFRPLPPSHVKFGSQVRPVKR